MNANVVTESLATEAGVLSLHDAMAFVSVSHSLFFGVNLKCTNIRRPATLLPFKLHVPQRVLCAIRVSPTDGELLDDFKSRSNSSNKSGSDPADPKDAATVLENESSSTIPASHQNPRDVIDLDVDQIDIQDEDGDDSDQYCSGEFLHSPSLDDYVEQCDTGLISPTIPPPFEEWNEVWALAMSEQKGFETLKHYSRVGILMERNFSDFVAADGCDEAYKNTTLEEITSNKARAVFAGTGLPCIAETVDMSIDAPESGSNINKSLQQGYYTRNIAEEADAMIEKVRPISDENRMTHFNSVSVFYNGEHEFLISKSVRVALVFCSAKKACIASAASLDDLFKQLSQQFNLSLSMVSPKGVRESADGGAENKRRNVLVGATLLRERIRREGKILGDGIIKVSSFVNHMVDADLMEVCGEELGERLRRTAANKILTAESTGLIVALPTARRLGIPLVFARKSRPITISDSYQTTYRSATKGTTIDLIVSCEYLESGDRVLIIDDFLAGGSTAEALFRLAKMAHAKVVGVGVLIEKMSDGGRTFLSGYDVPVESLAKVSRSGENGGMLVAEEEPWVPADAKMEVEEVRDEALRAKAAYYARADGKNVEEDVVEVRKAEDLVGEVDNGSLFDKDDVDEEDDGGVDIIRWEDDAALDDIEDELIR